MATLSVEGRGNTDLPARDSECSISRSDQDALADGLGGFPIRGWFFEAGE